MKHCENCQYYSAHERTTPATGTCFGEPPKNILLPMQTETAGLVAPGARGPALALQSTRPVVTATDRACALWRAAVH